MKKIIIIGVFALFTLTACEDNLKVTEDLSDFNISESEFLNNLQVSTNLPRDGRNPQTGSTIKIPKTNPPPPKED